MLFTARCYENCGSWNLKLIFWGRFVILTESKICGEFVIRQCSWWIEEKITHRFLRQIINWQNCTQQKMPGWVAFWVKVIARAQNGSAKNKCQRFQIWKNLLAISLSPQHLGRAFFCSGLNSRIPLFWQSTKWVYKRCDWHLFHCSQHWFLLVKYCNIIFGILTATEQLTGDRKDGNVGQDNYFYQKSGSYHDLSCDWFLLKVWLAMYRRESVISWKPGLYRMYVYNHLH